MNLARTTLALALGTALAGCGGGGEDFTNRPRIRIHWPPIGRATEMSPYANSIRITLLNARANPDTGATATNDVVIEANRVSDADSESVVAAPVAVKSGKLFASVVTFSQANQQGRQLQASQSSVLPDSQGFLPAIDLSPGSGTIRKVAISNIFFPTQGNVPAYQIGQDQSIYLFINDNNSLFFANPVYDSEIAWTTTFSENPDGPVLEGKPVRGSQGYFSFKSIHTGLVTVTATVDGVTSAPIQFRIVP